MGSHKYTPDLGGPDWYDHAHAAVQALPPIFMAPKALMALPIYSQTLPTMSPDTWPAGSRFRSNAAEPSMMAVFELGEEGRSRLDWAREMPLWTVCTVTGWSPNGLVADLKWERHVTPFQARNR